jgi:hypothetical protein
MTLRRRCGLLGAAAVLVLCSARLAGETVSVRFPEHEARARMVLLAADDSVLADGEWTQTVEGAEVTSRVVFHFRDGSLHDETVVFSQLGRFRLVHDRLVQRGPAFPYALDLSIDGRSGQVGVVCREPGKPERRYDERIDLPADLSNGMIPTLLRNVVPESPPRSLSLLVATPSPRLVRLRLSPPRREPAADPSGLLHHFTLTVEIGGIAGRLAPLVGKQPPDSHVWIADGRTPAYTRSQQPFFVGGPLWRIDVVR